MDNIENLLVNQTYKHMDKPPILLETLQSSINLNLSKYWWMFRHFCLVSRSAIPSCGNELPPNHTPSMCHKSWNNVTRQLKPFPFVLCLKTKWLYYIFFFSFFFFYIKQIQSPFEIPNPQMHPPKYMIVYYSINLCNYTTVVYF